MPKYRLLSTPFVTRLSSGTGVIESLALDHAPFTKITPVGTFVGGCVVFEKSPPLSAGFFGCVSWAEAKRARHTAIAAAIFTVPWCMSPPVPQLDGVGGPAGLDCATFST